MKCDRMEQCSHCVLSKSPCIYSIEPAQSVTPARSVPAPAVVPTRMVVPLARPNSLGYLAASYDTPLQASANGPFPSRNTFKQIRPKPTEAGSDGADSWPMHHASPTLNDPSELNELNRRLQSLEKLLSHSAPDSTIETPHGQKLPSISPSKETSHTPRDRRVCLNKSRLYGQSHWTVGAHEVSLASDTRQSATSTDN